jgi:hypothetical protein
MPVTKSIPVVDLSLDLQNFRTVNQPDEEHALHAMVSISPDYFWALADSLLDSGYLPTENILVLENGNNPTTFVVKEGNRRIAALKLIFGNLPAGTLSMPANVAKRIANLDPAWKAANSSVPCAVYPQSEAATVDRIITLAHGKGEKAGRDAWNAVARARHNKARGGSEPGLDLLEKYLQNGTNLSTEQAERWSGAYPLSVLDEAAKKLSPFFGVTNAPELAKNYPSVSQRVELDGILWEIGQELVRFPHLRKGFAKFIADHGLASPSGTTVVAGSVPAGAGTGGPQGPTTTGTSAGGGSTPGGSGSTTASGNANAPTSSGAAKKPVARSTYDPRTVTQLLRKFTPRGVNRQKVVALRDEAVRLDLNETPIAFCFLLRSMFEISAKAYCDDHKNAGGPSATKANGEDRRLVDVLRDVADYMSRSKTDPTKKDPAMQRLLHGAMTEIANPHSILSVTSMNLLVHSPTFSITAASISSLFGNIFPFLEEMNK